MVFFLFSSTKSWRLVFTTSTGWAKKRGHRLMTIILSVLILNQFKKFFSPEDSLVNLQLNGYQKIKIPLHLLHIYGVVRLLITKFRKVYCWVCEWKKFLKSVIIWQSYRHERDCLMHLCAWPTQCYKREKVHETICHCISQNPVISCLIFFQTGFTMLVLAYPDCSGKEAVKWV